MLKIAARQPYRRQQKQRRGLELSCRPAEHPQMGDRGVHMTVPCGVRPMLESAVDEADAALQ
jgi:hypothetical protein